MGLGGNTKDRSCERVLVGYVRRDQVEGVLFADEVLLLSEKKVRTNKRLAYPDT